jgi:hypothetical protein
MHLYRTDADAEVIRDQLVRAADRDRFKNLPLAGAEQRHLFDRPRCCAISGRRLLFCERGIDGGEQLDLIDRLLDKIDGTRPSWP